MLRLWWQVKPKEVSSSAFSNALISIPAVVISRDTEDHTHAGPNLDGRRMAVLPGDQSVGYFREYYRGAELVQVRAPAQALHDVSLGLVDAYALNLSTASYLIDQLKITNIHLDM